MPLYEKAGKPFESDEILNFLYQQGIDPSYVSNAFNMLGINDLTQDDERIEMILADISTMNQQQQQAIIDQLKRNLGVS
jgi:hypothetical protein